MAFVFVEIGLAILILVLCIALMLEVRRGRKVAQEIRDAIRESSEAQVRHREVMMARAARVFSEVTARADEIVSPMANDNARRVTEDEEPPGTRG